MIDKTATIEKYGYDPDALSSGSKRWVVAVCNSCGIMRDVRFKQYRDLCWSCAMKDGERRKKISDGNRGKHVSEETRKKISVARLGRTFSDETKKKMSDAQKGKPRPWLQGKNSPSWKGGISPWRNQLAGTIPYKNWRTAIFKRDDYTCQMCGERGGKLQAHHIRPVRDNINTLLIFDIDNGITLCEDCHISISGHEEGFKSFFDNKIKGVK